MPLRRKKQQKVKAIENVKTLPKKYLPKKFGKDNKFTVRPPTYAQQYLYEYATPGHPSQTSYRRNKRERSLVKASPVNIQTLPGQLPSSNALHAADDYSRKNKERHPVGVKNTAGLLPIITELTD